MSQARRATKAQTQQQQQQAQHSGYPQQHFAQPQPQQQSGYPQPQYPQQSGYPQPQYPQQSGYPQQQYPQQQSGYPQQYPQQQSGYPQPQYPQQPAGYPQQQQYAQQQYTQQQYAQQQYPQQGHGQQQAYAQQAHSQHQQQPSDPAILESGVHPADLEGRTIVRPFARLSAAPATPAVTQQADAPSTGNALHNDTVIAISPFADPFAIARLQQKSDPPHGSAALAETKIQTVDAATFAASAPSPAPILVGHTAFAQTALQPQVPQQHAYPQMQHTQAPQQAQPAQQPQQAPQPKQPKQQPMIESAPIVVRPPSARNDASPLPRAAPAPVRIGVRGVGSIDVAKLDKFKGRFGGVMVPIMGLAAVAVAIAFDVLFLKITFGPGLIGKLWYLTTAASFAGAGYGAAVMTRGSKGLVITTAIVVALIYGAADLGLEAVIEGIPVVSALILAIQGVVIALVCGIGAALTGLKRR